MRHHTSKQAPRPVRRHTGRFVALLLAILALGIALGVSSAQASKQVTDYFGTPPGGGSLAGGKGALGGEFFFPRGVAVNNSGAGPASKGEIYITDAGQLEGQNSRVQRFSRNDNGTPSNPYDDTYGFVSAWGSDADSTPTGGNDYEICTVAAECKAGVKSGGNGTVAGDGTLALPLGIAVDQDTGDVYVADVDNYRVNVYQGDGTFLRSFGWDVVASGPDQAGVGYEVCVAANNDVCKIGVPGTGVGQVERFFTFEVPHGSAEGIAVSQADGNPATGRVFLADRINRRVNSYGLDGSSPSSIGSSALFGDGQPQAVAVDSRSIVYASNRVGESERRIERYDSQNANGLGVGFLAPIANRNGDRGLAVDSDSDGAGPETDVLYALPETGSTNTVLQFGPVNAPGLTASPTAIDEEHGTTSALLGRGLAIDEPTGNIYVASSSGGGQEAHGIYVLNVAGGQPSVSLDSVDTITATSVAIHATVNPNGPPDVRFDIEYSTNGSTWTKDFSEPIVGHQETPQTVSKVLQPLPGGLEPNTLYHLRVVATKKFAKPVISGEKTFTTLRDAPSVETTGSPIRTATTARLDGRLNPRNSATTYHFEYGTVGPCDENPCESSAPIAAGSGGLIKLVSQRVEGLQPNTAYHYRLVAESPAPGSPTFGEDMIVTTRASDAPLSHGHLVGPPGSDRAWEQVNVPDTGGNPVTEVQGISDDGSRVIYGVAGGTPLSTTGSLLSQFFAQRTATGWQPVLATPPRDQLASFGWGLPSGRTDLSELVLSNAGEKQIFIWRLSFDAPPVKVFAVSSASIPAELRLGVSEDATRIIANLSGPQDPEHPMPVGQEQLYDISSGTPHLVSFLPGNAVPTCGTYFRGAYAVPTNNAHAYHWLSPDGSRVFFASPGGNCGGEPQIYLRDLVAGETKLISPLALSGPSCGAGFIRATNDDAAFFWSASRLTPDDTPPRGGCPTRFSNDGIDVYRYDRGDGSLECVTCVVPGGTADVVLQTGNPGPAQDEIAVAPNGSRVYFSASHALLPGAGPGAYRVNVVTGDLAYVGPTGDKIGDQASEGEAISRDGSVLIFRSRGEGLNVAGSQDNGGTDQYYRYDDDDRSLICVSCPQDGSASRGPVGAFSRGSSIGPNTVPLTSDGEDFAFNTPSPLRSADQNTARAEQSPVAGTDTYEWRDGRVLLVSDGLTGWPESTGNAPTPAGISPDGRDIYFIAAVQLTPDALDSYPRLYDARIGGGFEFPQPPPPCPLEVCQGTPKGVPEEAPPGTRSFSGPGNAQPVRHQEKRHSKKKHHKKKRQHRPTHNRRAAR
jgi:hypothetical protein